MTPPAPTDSRLKAASEAMVGRVIGERYRIDAVIATGGMGVVYRAEHLHMRKEVAIKILQQKTEDFPELVLRFEREAVAGAHISHPNVATAHDFGTFDGESRYLVMELVRGVTLREIIDRGPTPVPRTLRIVRQLVAALGGAHDMGIVHRDLKPRNVMVEEANDDSVKLIDFGFARVPADRLFPSTGAEDGERTSITAPGSVFGTVAYMAPETALGMGSVDQRSDLYAVGVIFYELLTGEHPFDATEPYEQFAQTRNELPPEMSIRNPAVSVPADVEALVRRLLEKDPNHRYPNTAELSAALETLSAPTPSVPPEEPLREPPPPQPTLPPSPPKTRSMWPIWLVLNVAVLGVIALAVTIKRPSAPRETKTTASATTEAPPPIAESAATPVPATTGSSVSAEALALRFQMLRAAAGPDTPAGPQTLLALVDADPTSFWNGEVKTAASTITSRAATRGGDDADRVFYAMSYKLGSDGLDILYDVIASGRSTRGGVRAKATLSDADIRARATPAMRIAFDMRRMPCQERPRLFSLAASDGDERVALVLESMRDRRCDPKRGHCCFKANETLDRALSEIRGRGAK